MMDDYDYPPYAKDPQVEDACRRLLAAAPRARAALDAMEARERRRDRLIVILCGLVAGVAIGGLIVAYGVF